MNASIRLGGIFLFAGVVVFGAGSCHAGTVPMAARFYSFIGVWHGAGQLGRPGHRLVRLRIRAHCEKAAAGWAVRCSMDAVNPRMEHVHSGMSEADLMGVDSTTGTAHWYAVTDQGEAYDHIVRWRNSNTMVANHAWIWHRQHMRETVVFGFMGKRQMKFRSVVRDNGRVVESFEGSLRREPPYGRYN